MLIPSWVQPRTFVWWKYTDGDRVLCRVGQIGHETVSIWIMTATAEQCLRIRRGVGEVVTIQYSDGLIEIAR